MLYQLCEGLRFLSGLQALPAPCAVGSTRIEYAIMQTGAPTLPEFDIFRNDPIPTPVLGTGRVRSILLFCGGQFIFQYGTVSDRLALFGRNCA